MNLEKVQERWWDAVFVNEPKLSVRKMECSRPMTDLDDEAQTKIEQMMYDDHRKKLGLPTHEEQVALLTFTQRIMYNISRTVSYFVSLISLFRYISCFRFLFSFWFNGLCVTQWWCSYWSGSNIGRKWKLHSWSSLRFQNMFQFPLAENAGHVEESVGRRRVTV